MSNRRFLNLDALCVVLATQRSGSTAFSRALKQTGVFGRPRELYLETKLVNRDDVLDMLEMAEFPSGSRTAGIKLMLDQIPDVAEKLCGHYYGDNLSEALQCLIDDLGVTCEVSCFGILRDDAVAMAISVGFAHVSGVWHTDDHPKRSWQVKEIDAIAKKALTALPRIQREIKQLKRIKAEVPEIMWFNYDQCAELNFRISNEILERCASKGLRGGGLPEREAAIPDTGMYKKIVHPSDEIKVRTRMKELNAQIMLNR